jgi:hypothetical protein
VRTRLLKVTRHIEIRNSQGGGSSHHQRISIVAGNRLVARQPAPNISVRCVIKPSGMNGLPDDSTFSWRRHAR